MTKHKDKNKKTKYSLPFPALSLGYSNFRIVIISFSIDTRRHYLEAWFFRCSFGLLWTLCYYLDFLA